MKIRKGDTVRVLSGKDRGKEGEVTRVLPLADKVFVDGVNIAKRHTRPNQRVMQGGIIDKHMPIHASTVAILCSKCGPTRAGTELDKDNFKIRVCRKCGGEL